MENYLKHAIIVDQTLFGIDKEGNVVYKDNEEKIVGQSALYSVTNFPVGHLQRFFEQGNTIYLFRDYENRGCVVNFNIRQRLIQHFGYSNPKKINEIVIEKLNKEAKEMMEQRKKDGLVYNSILDRLI